jgi:hypothetical protein
VERTKKIRAWHKIGSNSVVLCVGSIYCNGSFYCTISPLETITTT